MKICIVPALRMCKANRATATLPSHKYLLWPEDGSAKRAITMQSHLHGLDMLSLTEKQQQGHQMYING